MCIVTLWICFFCQFQSYFVFSNFCKQNYSNIDACHLAIYQTKINTYQNYQSFIKVSVLKTYCMQRIYLTSVDQ